MRTLGKLIKEQREKEGLTQIQLAERLGIHQPAICSIERNAKFPMRTSYMEKIAEWLGIPYGDLLEISIRSRSFYND